MNKGKRILSLLLLCIVCLFFVFTAVRAEENVGISRSAGKVTGYKKITWGLSTGRYYVNDIHAFCAQYSKSWPPVGTTIDSISLSTNEVLRKALYYGYNGPANVLGTDDRAHVLTAIAVSDANIGERETGASSKYDEFYWDIVNNPSKYPSPPSNFKAYMAITASDDLQNLAFYILEENGYVKLEKTSADTTTTNGNSCYSLEGAIYGIYKSADLSASSLVGNLITNANGVSNTLELSPGTYYAYEVQAPKGYEKSAEILTLSVTSKQTTVLHVKDNPQTYDLELLLEKVDSETGKNEPQGKATLKGAQFVVKFYSGLWEPDVDPDTLGVEPTKTWVFETDTNGRVYYQDSYKVTGDDLYANIPIGTLTIQEQKAPEGYFINDTIFVRQIKQQYNYPIVEEQLLKVRVVKYQAGTDIVVPNTTFEHISPDGTKEYITTGQNGEAVICGLQYGKHTLQEVSVMEGYELQEEPLEFSVDEQVQQDIYIAVYNEPESYSLVLQKNDPYGNLLPGAEFSLYSDAECEAEICSGVTDENGILRLEHLEADETYYLKETKAPIGYQIPFDESGKVHVYEICARSVPVQDEFKFFLDGQTDVCTIGGTTAKREVYLTITNHLGDTLPNTGTCAVIAIPIAGVAMCVVSIYQMKKQQIKNEKGE